ncbi:Histidine kinase-, DNA gyrase B-, and HSP90-like ATPase [compost metagenome]
MISVRDNGIGIAAEDLKKIEANELKTGIRNGMKHIGIANIRERLVYLCGEAASATIQSSEGVGTEVLLHIPLIQMITD